MCWCLAWLISDDDDDDDDDDGNARLDKRDQNMALQASRCPLRRFLRGRFFPVLISPLRQQQAAYGERHCVLTVVYTCH